MSKETRTFVCPYCGESHDSQDGLKSHVFKSHKGRGLPAAEGRIKLTINKAEHSFLVEPNWTLYYLIHDVLCLVDSQFNAALGCGQAASLVRFEDMAFQPVLRIVGFPAVGTNERSGLFTQVLALLS